MAEGEQERFEDYLELERYIEARQAGKSAHPPLNLTPEQIRVYQMATLFHSASDEDAQPRPEFIAQLKSQLLALNERQEEEESTRPPQEREEKKTPNADASEQARTKKATPEAQTGTGSIRRARFFSRRNLLAGGGIAAASLVIGAGVERAIYASQEQGEAQKGKASNNGYVVGQKLEIPKNIPTSWQFVTALADLGTQAVRFSSDSIIGYVVRISDESDYSEGGTGGETIIAMSAICTHMGCLLQWKDGEHHFYCPCHGAIFTSEGILQQKDYKASIPPLPRLNVKIENGNVYVEVPKNH